MVYIELLQVDYDCNTSLIIKQYKDGLFLSCFILLQNIVDNMANIQCLYNEITSNLQLLK